MSDEWECFSDPAYYDMWCVRQVGSRTFGEGFHLVNGDEAKMLCRFLNTRPADRIEAQAAEIERMREALGELSGNTGKLLIRENENG